MRFRQLSASIGLMLLTVACASSSTSQQSDITTEINVGAGSIVTQGAQPFGPSGAITNVLLKPGDYTTLLMNPAIRMTIGEFWQFRGDFTPLLLLTRIGGHELNFILFPSSSVASVAEAIQSEAVFESSETSPAVVDGLEGISFLVNVVSPGGRLATTSVFPSNEIYSRVDLNPPTFPDGRQIRFTLVPVGDNVITIMASSGPTGFDNFLETVDTLLMTVTFDEASSR
jgi:hypothetical protein